MNILFENEEEISKELLRDMEKSLSIALKYEGIPEDNIEVSVTFVTLEEIRELNKEYRGIDKETDVLSFPQFERDEELPSFGIIPLGDVVISKDKAEAQAKEFGHSIEREMVYLFTHSILHLLGYDHMIEDEKKVMRKREEEIMNELGISR